jgi:hypothetical protein
MNCNYNSGVPLGLMGTDPGDAQWAYIYLQTHNKKKLPVWAYILLLYTYILQNTQEATTHSAAPSKCIHSNTQEFHMGRTGTSQQHSINQHRAKLLQTFIRGHAHASPEAGATRPSQHDHRCSIRQEITPAQTYTQLPQGARHK